MYLRTFRIILYIFIGIISHSSIAYTLLPQWVFHSAANAFTFSSTKSVDINGDNYEDILIGNMLFSQDSTYSQVTCINGATGMVLWRCNLDCKYLYGNTVFAHINNDSIVDILIGGASGALYGIDGRDGSKLWQFYNDSIPSEEVNIYNFYNPKVINDQNGDGIQDMLIINGGNQNIEPHAAGRKTGYLMIVDATNGLVLAKDSFPDRKESYYSPIIFTKNNDTLILYGTGGETDSGSLWMCTLEDVRKNKVFANSIRLDGPYQKGFIQPCILADFNEDTLLDILSINLDGYMKLIDGSSYQTIWEKNFVGYELYTEPSIVYIGNDAIPDIYIKLSKGEFNDEAPYQGFKGIIVDGATGYSVEIDTLGYYYAFNSSCSFMHGGHANLLQLHNVHVNDINYVRLSEINLENSTQHDTTYAGFSYNYNSTPLLKDLNNDQYAELVTVYNTRDSGFYINCYSTAIYADSILWGSYYGNDDNSIYNVTKKLLSNTSYYKSNRSLAVTPNPSKMYIRYETDLPSTPKDLLIFNANGTLAKSIENSTQTTIAISDLNFGMYILIVIDNVNKQISKGKFLKM